MATVCEPRGAAFVSQIFSLYPDAASKAAFVSTEFPVADIAIRVFAVLAFGGVGLLERVKVALLPQACNRVTIDCAAKAEEPMPIKTSD